MPARETSIQVITSHCLLLLRNAGVSWFSPTLYPKAKVMGEISCMCHCPKITFWSSSCRGSGNVQTVSCWLQSSDNFFFIIPLEPHIFPAPYSAAIPQSQSIFTAGPYPWPWEMSLSVQFICPWSWSLQQNWTEQDEDRSPSYFLSPWNPGCSWLSKAEKEGWEDTYLQLSIQMWQDGPDRRGDKPHTTTTGWLRTGVPNWNVFLCDGLQWLRARQRLAPCLCVLPDVTALLHLRLGKAR